MLTTLAMLVCSQLSMQGITADAVSMKLVSQPEVIVKTVEKIVTQRVYVYVDKFGVEHEGTNKAALYNEVYLENQKPFRMKDRDGKMWEHMDKAVLEKFVADRNKRADFPVRPAPPFTPQAFYMPASPVWNFPAASAACGPVG